MLVEIGIQNRKTQEILTTEVEKSNFYTYVSIGAAEDNKISVYAFESNAVLLTLKETATDATIQRELLRQYKLLKPGAVKRLRKEGKV